MSPLYFAVTVRSTAFANVSAHDPVGALPVQLSPVLAWIVTVPVIDHALLPCGATVQAMETGLPASKEPDVTLVMTVVVAA